MNNYSKKYEKEMVDKAYQYSAKYNLKITKGTVGWNDEGDAFRHAYVSSLYNLKYGKFGDAFWDLHEFQGNIQKTQPKEEENMDKWNNLEGRKIAQEIKKEYSSDEIKVLIKSGQMDDIIAEKVIQKMKKGELITDPETDERKYTENSFMNEILNLKNRVFHKGELSMDDLKNGNMQDAFLEQIYDNKELPAKEELDERTLSGELVHVDNYTRSDGTKVSGYYRAYPKG